MKVTIPQNPATLDPSLLEPSHALNQTDRSFEQYLEEEKKRLSAMFSPLSSFNFSGLFGYAQDKNNDLRYLENIDLFSDINSKDFKSNDFASNSYLSNSQPVSSNQTVAQTIINQITDTNQTSATKVFLQQLLAQTGWLTPNIEAQQLLQQMQSQGKLLNNFDLQALVDKIVSQVKLVKEKGQTQLSLGLKPDNLGEILLTLIARSGLISIQIQAPEESRKLILSQAKELELALKRANINLGEIKILAINPAPERGT